MELLFLNMHNLINAFRPHQARETVIHMLETQIRERQEAVREIRRTIDESRRAVERVHGELHETANDLLAVDDAPTTGIDGDVKMECTDGVTGVGGGGDESHVSGAVSTVTLTPAQQEQTEVRCDVRHAEHRWRWLTGCVACGEQKAREARRMQEQFFAALETAMS